MSTALESVDPEVTTALETLRNDKTGGANYFVLVGFASVDDSKLVLLGSGPSSCDALAGIVPENDVAYGVVRKQYNFDDTGGGMGKTEVIKFIRVTWRPEERIPLKRKMKMGTLDAAIKKVLGPTHSDIEADKAEDLTDANVVALIERVTQRADMVSAAAGKAPASFQIAGVAVQARSASSDKAAAVKKTDGYLDTSLVGSGPGAEVSFEDLDAIKAGIAAVRADADPTTWVLTGYKDKKTIEMIGTGTGDVSELIEACKPGTMCYGLFRVTEQIDRTQAVKFCLLTWQPEDIPVMTRAVLSTHKGAVLPVFRPYNVDFLISTKDELNHEGVMDHIMSLSGTKSKVTDARPAAQAPAYEKKTVGGLKADAVEALEFTDKEALMAAVRSVRNDKEATRWVVASYDVEGKTSVKLSLRGTGEGGAEEFAEALAADQTVASYGLLRTQEQIDRSVVVKFVFVTHSPHNMAPLLKAKISTLRGAVLPIFHPYHAEMLIDDKAELTEAVVAARLR